MDTFGPLLQRPRTLIYVCGIAGMQLGLFQVFARHGVAGPYLNVKDELASVDPNQWETEKIKRYVRPTHRCMLEVYD
jgi:ferredoxin--NADP+ reductase